MQKQVAHPVSLAPPPAWMRDLINQVVDELAQSKGGMVYLSSSDVKDRLTVALRHRSDETADELIAGSR